MFAECILLFDTSRDLGWGIGLGWGRRTYTRYRSATHGNFKCVAKYMFDIDCLAKAAPFVCVMRGSIKIPTETPDGQGRTSAGFCGVWGLEQLRLQPRRAEWGSPGGEESRGHTAVRIFLQDLHSGMGLLWGGRQGCV